MAPRDWTEVTPRSPCPVCGHAGWCARSRDGLTVLCRREPRGGLARVDRAGVPYFVHRVNGGAPVPIGEVLARRVSELEGPASREPAPVEVRDRIYRRMLSILTLEAAHREALRARGLPDSEIDRRGYRSLLPPGPPWNREKVARDLVDRYGPEVERVPGIARRVSRRTGRPFATIAGPAGLLVPVRDPDGRIAALIVRPDEPRGGAKYLWITSHPTGPGPGDAPGGLPAHVPLPPAGGRDPERVRVSEGVLKGDVATALDPAKVLTVGVPGVTAWRAALPILETLRPRIVHVALDNDWRTNPLVARALLAAVKSIQQKQYEVKVETWQTPKA